jgi:A/G-specific adenine glycosylase
MTSDLPNIRVFRRELALWGSSNRRSFPWRHTEEPFEILLAEVLLQRSRGRTVAVVYEELLRRWPDPGSLSKAHTSSIRAVIRPLGLVRRAATIKTLGAEVSRLGGVPTTIEGLMQLPGVGRYAANATLAAAFGMRSTTVDGVSARVYRRFFDLQADRPASEDEALWEVVEHVTPRTKVREWNWAVLDLAAAICLPRRPLCDACPLSEHCAWSQAQRDRVTAQC